LVIDVAVDSYESLELLISYEKSRGNIQYINELFKTVAKHERYLPIVKLLVENGADINHVSVYPDGLEDYPCLSYAVNGGAYENVKYLIENGADVDFSKIDYSSRWVISFNILSYLLSYGADVNVQDRSYGDTILMAAVKLGIAKYVEEILKFSPSLTLKNNKGQTALEIAKEKNIKTLFNY